MFEQYPGVTLLVFFIGLVAGVILTLLTNKLRSGSASPVKLKKEMDEYQDKVDMHFAETSKKFKQMTSQYQDLYQHLAEGATTLCRPDTIAADLIEGSSALQQKPAIEQKANSDKVAKGKQATAASTKAKVEAKTPPANEKPSANEKPLANEKPSASKNKTSNNPQINKTSPAPASEPKSKQKLESQVSTGKSDRSKQSPKP